MPGRWGLAGQTGAFNSQIDRMKQRLRQLTSAQAKDNGRLESTRNHLLHICSRLEGEVQTFASQLNGQPSTEDQWSRWVDMERQFRALAADCLALEQSVYFRGGVDVASLCAAADRLAETLSRLVGKPRPHYVLVSEAEHFGADASAIHLSYGRLDLWNFNRLVHEFGHLCGEGFGSGTPGIQSSFVQQLKSWAARPAKEFFADIMATFLAGPAYAYSCLYLDFNPADRSGLESHPSGDERAHCILIALKRMARRFHSVTKQQFDGIIRQLGESWATARAAAGMQKPVANLDELEYEAEIAVDSLAKEIPGAQYKSLSSANAVRNALANGGHLPVGAGGVDILNGAWLRRLAAQQADESAIGLAAVKMLLECSQ